MQKISRRDFLRGSAASAAVIAPASPALVAWFARWFDTERFYSLAGKEAPKPEIKIYNADMLTVTIGGIEIKGPFADGAFERIEPDEYDDVPELRPVKVPARIINAKDGRVELTLPELECNMVLQGDIRVGGGDGRISRTVKFPITAVYNDDDDA